VIVSGVYFDALSSPSVSAMILLIMFGYFLLIVLRLVTASYSESYNLVLPPGAELSTKVMNLLKSLIKSHFY